MKNYDDVRNRVFTIKKTSDTQTTQIYEMQSDHAYCELPDGFFARALEKVSQQNEQNSSRKLLEVKAGLGRHVITITSPF